MEIWKEIEGCSRYRVSNYGRVENINSGLILKNQKNKNTNVVYVGLTIDNIPKQKNFLLHRLVANAFVKKVDGKDFVTHIDNNKENNNANNLKWCDWNEIISDPLRNEKIGESNKNKTNKKVYVLTNTDEFLIFNSINQVADFVGVTSISFSKTYIAEKRLKRGKCRGWFLTFDYEVAKNIMDNKKDRF